MDSLKALFKGGVPRGKATLKWGSGIKAEVFLDGGGSGVPHGPFMADATSAGKTVWTAGAMREGRMEPAEGCWVVTADQARYGNCTDAFVFSEESPTVVLRRMHLAYVGEDSRPTADAMAVVGKMKGEQLKEARDCELTALAGETK